MYIMYAEYETKTSLVICEILFRSCRFRFGHSQIDDGLHYVHADDTTTDKPFIDLWRRPHDIYDENIGVDSVVRGLIQSRAQKSERLFSTSITTTLISLNPNQVADLVSLNIQRGRDHGLPSYNAWRSFCGLSVANDFSTDEGGFINHESADAAILDTLYRLKLQSLTCYTSVNMISLMRLPLP